MDIRIGLGRATAILPQMNYLRRDYNYFRCGIYRMGNRYSICDGGAVVVKRFADGIERDVFLGPITRIDKCRSFSARPRSVPGRCLCSVGPSTGLKVRIWCPGCFPFGYEECFAHISTTSVEGISLLMQQPMFERGLVGILIYTRQAFIHQISSTTHLPINRQRLEPGKGDSALIRRRGGFCKPPAVECMHCSVSG